MIKKKIKKRFTNKVRIKERVLHTFFGKINSVKIIPIQRQYFSIFQIKLFLFNL